MFCEWKPNKTRLSIQDKWKHIYSHVVISARRHLYFSLTLHRVRVELDFNPGSNSCCLRWTLLTRDETRVRAENALGERKSSLDKRFFKNKNYSYDHVSIWFVKDLKTWIDFIDWVIHAVTLNISINLREIFLNVQLYFI